MYINSVDEFYFWLGLKDGAYRVTTNNLYIKLSENAFISYMDGFTIGLELTESEIEDVKLW